MDDYVRIYAAYDHETGAGQIFEEDHAFVKSKDEPPVRKVMAISHDREIPSTRLEFPRHGLMIPK